MGYNKAITQRFRIKEALLLFLSYILPLIIRWINGCKRCARKEDKEEDSFFAPPVKSVLVSTAPWGLQLDQLL